mmetsp:Transcript_17237/g.45678  ORF Transcript_17237/g.45678 Transcript_17237/m.45678 type:complete len:259 (+) Transcript_17237:611-1387(+)
MQGHSGHLELDQVQLRPVVHQLGLLLLLPGGELVSDPLLRLRGRVDQQGPQTYGAFQVVDHRHHEDEAADKAAVVVLQAVLAGVDQLAYVGGPLREELPQAVPDERPRVPHGEPVEPMVGVLGTARPDAIRAVRARIDARTEVTQVHPARKRIEEAQLLVQEAEQKALDRDVEGQKDVAPDRQRCQRCGPADAPSNLWYRHRRAVDGVLLDSAVAEVLHLEQAVDCLPRGHMRVVQAVVLWVVQVALIKDVSMLALVR